MLPGGVVGTAHEKSWFIKIRGLFFRLVLIVILANLFLLDLYIFDNRFVASESTQTVTTPIPSTASFETVCTKDCEQQLHALVASMTASVIQTQSSSKEVPYSTPGVREVYIPLGSGSVANDEWANVPGATAYVDTSNYATIKSVTLEVSVRIPASSQYVYVRLYNVTDKHPVWGSDMSTYEATKLLVSPAITLDSGNKLYQLQMKTQLKEASGVVDQAKLHILTQ